ncbi:MAG TPA: ATP-dependent sacrificial sulfur transferase LarE, partial [Thermoplasmata archaeon]|nr:ATP-dependent sacrificial sulfur transferase LarE [Thermoplasmata archaeon]
MTSSAEPPPPRRTAEELEEWFAMGGPTLVALSGGVDSGTVARLAQTAAAGRVRAATLVGPAVASAEVERARAVARAIGIPHDLVPVDPLALEGYRSNPSNRCYFCRSAETAALRRFGEPLGFVRFVDGVHRDDLGDARPGIRALDEAGFEHPLLWAGWGKAEVRAYARTAGLPNWDLPADACLASRVPHGTPIDAALLRRVEAAESDLRARGYTRVRVRVGPDGARVEVDPDELPRLVR